MRNPTPAFFAATATVFPDAMALMNVCLASAIPFLGRAIFRDGPIEGRDRSTTLTHLAHECRKANLHPKDAMSLLEDADIRWGKYLARGEAGRLELEKLLVRAYGHIPSS